MGCADGRGADEQFGWKYVDDGNEKVEEDPKPGESGRDDEAEAEAVGVDTVDKSVDELPAIEPESGAGVDDTGSVLIRAGQGMGPVMQVQVCVTV